MSKRLMAFHIKHTVIHIFALNNTLFGVFYIERMSVKRKLFIYDENFNFGPAIVWQCFPVASTRFRMLAAYGCLCCCSLQPI